MSGTLDGERMCMRGREEWDPGDEAEVDLL